jgi:hypothetical protein
MVASSQSSCVSIALIGLWSAFGLMGPQWIRCLPLVVAEVVSVNPLLSDTVFTMGPFPYCTGMPLSVSRPFLGCVISLKGNALVRT